MCNSTERITDSRKAEIICAHCGLVLDENIIDQGPDWRAYDLEQEIRRSRTGAPLTYTIADKGLSTTMDWRNKDRHGRKFPEKNKAQIYRLRKLNKKFRVLSSGERNLAFALSELDRQSSRLNIPRSVREEGAIIYRKASGYNLIRGRTVESMVAASIYTACRYCNIPRTLDEISQASKVSKKLIGKNYRQLSRVLDIKLKPTSPADYIPRFASELGVSGKVISKAIDIVELSHREGMIAGKDPAGIAASALYLASILSGERRTQKLVAEIAGVAELTIRNRCNELSKLDF